MRVKNLKPEEGVQILQNHRARAARFEKQTRHQRGGRRAKSSAVAPPRGEVRRAVEFDGEPEKDEPKRFKHDEGTPQAVESDLKRVKLLHGRSDVILRTRLGVGEKMKQINSTF